MFRLNFSLKEHLEICVAFSILLLLATHRCVYSPSAPLPPAGSCEGRCPLMNVNIDSDLCFMNQRQFPLQAWFQARKLKTRHRVDKQQAESQTVPLHQTAVSETWCEPELHLPALFLHMKNILSAGGGRERWRPPRVSLLGSLAVDRRAGRQVRNRAVATSDGWTDNRMRDRQTGVGGGLRGEREGWKATTISVLGWLASVLGRYRGMWEGCQEKLSCNMSQPDSVVMESRAD